MKKWLRAVRRRQALEDAKPTSQRTVWQKVRKNWHCSQIEDRDEEEIMEWHEEDQLRERWEEDEKIEEILNKKEWTEVYGK